MTRTIICVECLKRRKTLIYYCNGCNRIGKTVIDEIKNLGITDYDILIKFLNETMQQKNNNDPIPLGWALTGIDYIFNIYIDNDDKIEKIIYFNPIEYPENGLDD